MNMEKNKKYLEKVINHFEPIIESLDLDLIGQYNYSYVTNYQDDRIEKFIVQEWPAYMKLLDLYRKHIEKGSTVLEVGGFIPILPVLLTYEGYKVSVIDKGNLYDNELDVFSSTMEKFGITSLNDDILNGGLQRLHTKFDAVNLTFVLEHLNGSPRQLLLDIKGVLKDHGKLITAVPNHTRLVRRLGMLIGISAHPCYHDYFFSKYPFTGHNREYTASELKFCLENTGYEICDFGSIKYGNTSNKLLTKITNLFPMSFHQALYAISNQQIKLK